MTTSTEISRWPYTGDGVTLPFAYTNLIFDKSELEVYVDKVLQTVVTDYSVSGVGVPTGGSVTFVVAPPNTEDVVIQSDVEAVQLTDFTPAGVLPSDAIETGLDRVMRVAQQLSQEMDTRVVRVNTEDLVTGMSLSLPAFVAGKVFRITSNGLAIELADGGALLSGSGAPAGGTGNDGDFYIDTAADTIYGPKTGGAWGSATSITGPTGATGATGSTGAAGADGGVTLLGSGVPTGGLGNDGDSYIRTAGAPGAGDYFLKQSGTWNLQFNIVGSSGDLTSLQQVAEVVQAFTGSGTKTINAASGHVARFSALTGGVTVAFSNILATALRHEQFKVYIEQDGTARAFTWPAAVTWGDAGVPDLSAINSTHVLTLTTIDQGTTIHGFTAGLGF